jgi:nucleoside-diphosphate kinase
VYKGVVAPGELAAMVDELTAGPCIALEVAARGGGGGGGAHAAWRALCGPQDPELARLLRPGSLRAQFGASRVRNGVHCTDLPEDAALEVDYFFTILAGQ